jgi:subtilisin family serine protease
MDPLDLVNLTALMERTRGRAEIRIGLIDGPILLSHPDLAAASLREVPGKAGSACSRASSLACTHGTFVAGVLAARRGSAAPAICPDCTLLVRPIFSEAADGNGSIPSATAAELASAIVETVAAGAKVLNMSVALVQSGSAAEKDLHLALDYAAKRGAIAVAAAGNQGTVGGTRITQHSAVIPVAACDREGNPMTQSNLGRSIARKGLSAPGEAISSLGTDGQTLSVGGTSAAAPFVTGTIALLWSEFPSASAGELKYALTSTSRSGRWRNTVVPPLIDAWGAYQFLATGSGAGSDGR